MNLLSLHCLLLGNDWVQPLHVIVPRSSPPLFEFEARHFRDLTTKSYVTDCAHIVVYYSWAAQPALIADLDTMGVAWVVHDSLWNASCASPQCRQPLVGMWANRTLRASSIDMSFAPPLIVVQVYNLGNFHWTFRLLLIASTREYLCLKFDPLCDQPHIVGANQEELFVVHLIAEQEGIQPEQRKKCAKILGVFGALAFAIAPLYSIFIGPWVCMWCACVVAVVGRLSVQHPHSPSVGNGAGVGRSELPPICYSSTRAAAPVPTPAKAAAEMLLHDGCSGKAAAGRLLV